MRQPQPDSNELALALPLLAPHTGTAASVAHRALRLPRDCRRARAGAVKTRVHLRRRMPAAEKKPR